MQNGPAAQAIPLMRFYGSTEHPSITATRLERDVPSETMDGTPLPGVEVRIVDDRGKDVTTGEIGEIWSRGPDCCEGYVDATLTR